jgi:Xaa-Pro aminopeptidase
VAPRGGFDGFDGPTLAERDRRWSAVRAEMAGRDLDCLIVYGSDSVYRDCCQNLRWLTNAPREGYLVFPADGEPTFVTFESGLDPIWVHDWRGGVPRFSAVLAARVGELGLHGGRIGTVGTGGFYGETAGFPYRTHQSLAEAFPRAELVEATDVVERLRRIKSAEEIRSLEVGSAIMRDVFAVTREVAGPGVRDIEVRAAILDALFRAGCEQGIMLLYSQGRDVMHGGQRGARLESGREERLEDGDVMLVEVDAVWRGYKAQFNQPFVVGDAVEEWPAIFETAARCFEEGVRTLRPGVTVGELEARMIAPIEEAGLTFGNPAFHGLGLGIEAPMGTYPRANHRADPDYVIEEGMVLELEPHPITHDFRRGASLGCPVLVAGDGCRPLADWWTPEPIAVA